jgi:anti-anti-sigma factor
MKEAGTMGDEILRVDVTHIDGVTVLTVEGEIDAASTLALQAPLNELSLERRIIIDMSGVRFMDSTGLSVILAQRIRMTERDGSIHIRNPSPAVQRLLDVSGLTEVLHASEAA